MKKHKKLLFICDHRFKLAADGAIYSPGYYPYDVWLRYLSVWDEITVVASSELCGDADLKGLSISSGDRVGFAFLPRISTVFSSRKLRKSVRGSLDDLMQRHDSMIARLPSEVGQEAVSLAKKNNFEYGVEVVSCVYDGLSAEKRLHGRIYAFIAYYRMRLAVSNAKSALYVTDFFLQKRYPTKGKEYVASNVNIKSVVNAAKNTEVIYSLSLGRVPLKIGMIGGFQKEYKGHRLLLAAAARAKCRLNVGFKLQLVGESSHTHLLDQVNDLELSDVVDFIGVLKGGAEINEWLDSIDIYIQPSLQEGLPRSMIEAMARGKPCIAFATGGITELLSSDNLAKAGDIEALSSLICKSIVNEKWRFENSRNNIEKSKNYLAENLSIKRADFYKSLVPWSA